jgi:hypothetical protein
MLFWERLLDRKLGALQFLTDLLGRRFANRLAGEDHLPIDLLGKKAKLHFS